MSYSESGSPLALQTSITRYRPAKGDLVIDLIGVVHIGEGDYYRQLNRQFELYDSVLYELVAPQGTRIPRGAKKQTDFPSNPMDMVGWMQGQAQAQLGLESQLELIDYQKSNFIHADLSPAQMSKKMAERGDTPLTLGLEAITEILKKNASTAKQNSHSNGSSQLTADSLFEMLDNPLKLKQMMARQFTDSGVMESGFGKSVNQLLITDRNKAAIEVLKKEVAKGNTKIAIFYGAAHMPDFEQRLVSQFGLSKTRQVWVDAWDLTKAPERKTDSTTRMLMNLLNELAK